MITKITKRNGNVVSFDAQKIVNAIAKAGKATGEFDEKIAKRLAGRVLAVLEDLNGDGTYIPHVEEVQDIVEEILLRSQYKKTAKAYIIYRDQHAKMREIATQSGIELVDAYLSKADWRVNENANVHFSLQGLNNYISSEISKSYWLNKIYPPEIREAYKNGAIHIHDLNLLSAYTYYGKEVVIAKNEQNKIYVISFEQLYEMINEEEHLIDKEKEVYVKYPQDFYVLDKNGWTKILRIFKKRKHKSMHFIKSRGGRSIIVTEDHPMITKEGEKSANTVLPEKDYLFTVDYLELLKNEHLYSVNQIDLLKELIDRKLYIIKNGTSEKKGRDKIYFNSISIKEIENISDEKGVIHTSTHIAPRFINLTHDFGYAIGFAIAEGYLSYDDKRPRCIDLSSKNYEYISKVRDGFAENNFYGCIEKRNDLYVFRIRNCFLRFLFEEVFKIKPGSRHIALPVNILMYNKDFVKGVIAGVIDGDGNIESNKTTINIRTASRTLLEMCSVVMSLLGLTPRDRNVEGQGSVRQYNGRIIKQNYPIYGVSFRKKSEVQLNSDKYQKCFISEKAWHDETTNEWHLVINNEQTEIPDNYIYDITTESTTLIVNGMWNHNCVGWDLQDLLRVGFRGLKGRVESNPPKHFRVALMQAVNFLYTLQNETAGASAFSNFDTLLAPFIAYDNLTYKQVKQCMQEFLFNINVPTRTAGQVPFTNITLDITVPSHLKDQAVIIGGIPQDKTYGEFQEYMDMFNQALFECMMEGDASGRVFSFPIPTINITKEFDWHRPVVKQMLELTAKYGTFYFANFVNSDMKPEDTYSMCCRLRLDKKELQRKGGGLFGANALTGCYDEQTEILTKNGWKYFKDLTMDDEIYTVTKDNVIEIHKPVRLFTYDYDGEMIRFKSKSFDLLVTPNHRMYVYDIHQKYNTFVEAEKFNPSRHYIPKYANWKGEEKELFILPEVTMRNSHSYIKETINIPMDSWLKFLGIWIAEGSIDNDNIAPSHGYRVVITQKKENISQEIEQMLKELPFNFTKKDEHFIIHNKQLWFYLKRFGKQPQRFIPAEIKQLSKRQLSILFEWLLKGDGHVRKTTNQINLWTTSKQLSDDIQEIMVKLGYVSTVTIKHVNNKKYFIKGREITFKHNVFNVGLQSTKYYVFRKKHINREYYKGKVYCCEVPNNTVFVRRNGKTTWCGNSIGVVTINLPRIGYLSASEKDYFERLEALMNLAKNSLEIKRKVLERLTEMGLYPYAKFYLRSVKEKTGHYWSNHFSTIGIIGMNESIANAKWFDTSGIWTEEGKAFALKVMDFMREKLIQYQEETGNFYNLEATPAEGTSYRFAKIDKQHFPDIITQGNGDPYYTNSTWLPVGFTESLHYILDHQDELQSKYTGGTVQHIFLGKSPDPEKLGNFIMSVFTKYKLPYISITPTFSICKEHGYIEGEHSVCPKCGAECEIYSRVVGYIRPVNYWNNGKKAEFKDRKYLILKEVA